MDMFLCVYIMSHSRNSHRVLCKALGASLYIKEKRKKIIIIINLNRMNISDLQQPEFPGARRPDLPCEKCPQKQWNVEIKICMLAERIITAEGTTELQAPRPIVIYFWFSYVIFISSVWISFSERYQSFLFQIFFVLSGEIHADTRLISALKWMQFVLFDCRWQLPIINEDVPILILKIQTHKRFKRTLFVKTKHSMRYFGVILCIWILF